MQNQFLISFSKKLALAFCFFALCASAFAQQKISGTVLDVSKQPVIGATVMEKGTTNGVSTSLDGEFTLTVAPGSTIVVSCIGYADQEANVTSAQSVYNFTLSEDNTMLEETVVIGYGTVKVKDLTGSVAAVGSKDLQTPVANVGEALQGKMAGVVVSLNDATPGAEPQIRVRGAKSITQTNDPLYIVDGFPVGSLANIPSDQIKSINVLKDAAATAIYGSRGASGVVIVTTKNAIEGQTQVTYNGFVQIKDSSSNVRDVMDTYDYLKFTIGYANDYNPQMANQVRAYFGIGKAYGDHYADYANVKTHNWQSDLYKTGISHSHNLTVSNGTKKNKTIFSINFINDDGTVINSYYKRFNTSLKTIEKLTDNLDVELNVNYTHANNRSNPRLASAFRYRPIAKPLGDDTVIGGFGAGYEGYLNETSDPVELTWNEQNNGYINNFRGIAAINWTPIQGLKLRSELGYSKNFRKDEGYVAGYGTTTNSASLRKAESDDLHWTNTISYELPIKNENHRADLMLGSEWIQTSSEWQRYYAENFPSHFDRERTLAMLSQGTKNNAYTQYVNMPTKSMSFFARANYGLMDKYLFTFTMRADGSSKFAANNRWGFFPAGAFAWRAIDEDFMQGAKSWLSNLKLRLSYGVTGSDAISSSLWKETWSLSTSATNYTISGDRNDTQSGYGYPYAPGSMMQNPDLKWESTISRNLGIDYGFLDERIYGTIEGYWSTTNDLLMPVSVNSASGYTYQYQNMGVVSNKGLEFSIGADLVRTADFTLSANLIYNYNVNRIEKLSDSVTSNRYGQWVNSEHRPSEGEYILKEGYAIGTVMGYEYDGWYTTGDFNYDASTGTYTLKDGIPDWSADSYFSNFNLPSGQNAFPGAAKVKDQNGDGKITADDTIVIGEMTPRSNGSLNLSGRWKNLDFSILLNTQVGNKILNAKRMQRGTFTDANYDLDFYKNCWRDDNKSNVYPSPEAASTSFIQQANDFYVEDASFFRIQNVQLGYSFTGMKWAKSIRLYISAQRPLSLFRYNGFTTEIGGSPISSGIDSSVYPMQAIYTAGVNFNF